MTLRRQLAAVIVGLFVLLFAGTMAITVNDTRDYLNAQLRTITQDTATSLGLSLSPALAAGDMAVVESMVNAVFDSGYYRRVAITGIDGKVLLERQPPSRIEGVPDWFRRLLPLETPRGEALVMAGWQQAGTVAVSANPGQAYLTLWRHGINAFWWFLGMMGVTGVLGTALLHLVLRPLRRVEQQALAICGRDYQVQETLPRTPELRRVVAAMNLMSGKIRDMFEEQGRTIERMRAEGYRDALTGLANRRDFDMRLAQMIESSEEVGPGALLFIELKDIKGLNARRGYQAGDEALREVARAIVDACRQQGGEECFTARLAGGSFAVITTGAADEALLLGRNIAAALAGLHARGQYDSEEVCHVGIAPYRGHDAAAFLADADMALRAAQGAGPNAVYMQEGDATGARAILPASGWGALLREAIAQRRFELHAQPVLAADHPEILQYETFLRIPDGEGRLVAAGVFLPMARRAGLEGEIDRMVVSEVLARIASGRVGEAVMAVNLAPSSVQDPAFSEWLCAALSANPAAAARVAFEVAEYGVQHHLESLRALAQRVRALGATFGIDRFGRGFSSYAYLATLPIDYLKIDGGFVRGIGASQDNRFLVDSIVKIAHGLDLRVVAESVETEEEWTVLAELGVDGVQGYGVGTGELGQIRLDPHLTIIAPAALRSLPSAPA
ncbi:MAG: bifunctional diguanylate cyclase/phosphodiesterase [Noviherbaspirillum sp.]